MEETFLRVKNERDELIKRHNRDSTDGKPATCVTEEIVNLKTELKRQKAHYEAQFIEYVSDEVLRAICSNYGYGYSMNDRSCKQSSLTFFYC
jgi:hypothetical protein